jgi:beta-lactamase regulating signal transducer with metallopeptidase domain
MASFLEILLSCSIRIGAGALVIWGALIFGKVRSSSLRHTAWLIVLCAMPLMPILSHIAPHFYVPGIQTSVRSEALQIMPMSQERLENVSLPQLASNNAEHSAAAVVSAARPSRIQMPDVPTMIFLVYLSGVAILLWRCMSGLRMMRRIIQSSQPVFIDGMRIPILESDLVFAPVTFGLKTRRILLPAGWKKWPKDNLRAVLAHESEHVKRGDTIVNFIACMNRCFFWFHPLAWWLERQLALTAEQACDDAGVRALGETRKYASILLDMAEAVRRRGALLSFSSAGVAGTGLLNARIDRLLREYPFSNISQSRKILVALSCAAAILLAAACHRRDIYTGELRPNPSISASLEKQKAMEAIHGMNEPQVASVESAVAKNPEDLESRRKLMSFYFSGGSRLYGPKEAADRFWKHKLWFIQNHPEQEAASFVEPFWNQAAHEQAKKMWLAVAEQKNASISALHNAARFFENDDCRLAEQIYIRLQAAAPDKLWPVSFGRLYSEVIAKGPEAPLADEFRKKLDQSKDPTLLAITGYDLAMAHPNDYGMVELGRSYLERAYQIDSNSYYAKTGLALVARLQKGARTDPKIAQAMAAMPSEAQYQTVSTVTESERFRYLPKFAETAYIRGDMLDYYQHDERGARSCWEFSRRYSQDALQLAPRFRGDGKNYGNAIYAANMVLGMIAMRLDADIKSATRHLLAASETPSAEIPTYLSMRLPTAMLRYGGIDQREAVIKYLERCGRIIDRPDIRFLEDAQKLRKGIMPIWYQYQIAKLK